MEPFGIAEFNRWVGEPRSTKKVSHFQRFGQKLGVRDGLVGVVRVGGGKQKITVSR